MIEPTITMPTRIIVALALSLSAVAVTACGGGEPAAPSPTPNPGGAPAAPPASPAPVTTIEAAAVMPLSLDGGQPATGTVVVTRPAPEGGLVVMLTSSETTAATVPASITIPAGAASATFDVSTQAVDGDTPVTISASTGGQPSRSVGMSVNTMARLESFSRVSPYVRGGTRGTVTVRLFSRANRQTVVRIESSNPSVVAPQTVTIPPSVAVLDATFSTPFLPEDTGTVLSTSVGGQRFTQEIIVNTPPALAFTSTGNDPVGQGQSRRFESASTPFFSTTCCRQSQVLAEVNGGFGSRFFVYFRGPRGSVINPGTYQPDSNGTGFSIYAYDGVTSRSCSQSSSRFTVTKASSQPSGTINRFHATFEQTCTNGGSISGEINLDAMQQPSLAGAVCSC
jgi:hypothetical protein